MWQIWHWNNSRTSPVSSFTPKIRLVYICQNNKCSMEDFHTLRTTSSAKSADLGVVMRAVSCMTGGLFRLSSGGKLKNLTSKFWSKAPARAYHWPVPTLCLSCTSAWLHRLQRPGGPSEPHRRGAQTAERSWRPQYPRHTQSSARCSRGFSLVLLPRSTGFGWSHSEMSMFYLPCRRLPFHHPIDKTEIIFSYY